MLAVNVWGGIEVANNDKFFTSTIDGKSATLWRDLDRTNRKLLEIAPEDSEEINKFVKYIRLLRIVTFQ